MAYGEKYWAQWKDKGGTTHEIKLLQDGGSGTTEITTLQKTPYTRSVRGSKKSQLDANIFGSDIQFNFIVASADIDTFDAILESDYKEWKIEHYYDSVLDFVGWLQPDNVTRPYIKNGDLYFMSYSAVDGLANLKNTEFTNFSDGSQYDDRVTIMTTIKRALEHVGLELDFKVQLGTWCTNDSLMISTECALDKVTHDSRRFQKTKDGRLTNTNIYKVISELLEPFSCYLMQSEAKYWIINTREDDSYYFPIAWSDLSVGSRTASDLKISKPDNDDYRNRGTFQKIRPLESVGATFRNRNVQDNSLTNGDFHLPNTDEWVEGTGFEDFTTAAFGLNYELATAIVIPAFEPTEPPDFHSVAQAIVVRGESDQIQVQFKVRCAGLTMDAGFSGASYDAYVQVSCQIRKGTATGEIINPGAGPVMLGNTDSEYRLYQYYMDITEDDDYFVEILIDKLESTEWSDYDTIDIRFDDFDIIAAYSTGEDITFDKYFKVSNSDSSFTDFLDVETNFGDSASDTDIGAFKISGTLTETWSRFGKTEDISINLLTAKNVIENFSKYKDYLRITIKDETDVILPHSILVIDSSKYQIVSQTGVFTGDARKELELELIEILNAAVSVTIQEVGLSTTDGDGGSNSPFADAVTNPSTNPSQNTLVLQTLQGVTDVGNTTTNNILVTSANDSYFTGGGNVGFGTDSPSSLVHIDGGGGNGVLYLESAATGQSQLLFGASDGQGKGAGYIKYSDNSDLLLFGTNSQDQMAILSSGNVGIGTNSPGETLEVNGIINATTNLQEGGVDLEDIYQPIGVLIHKIVDIGDWDMDTGTGVNVAHGITNGETRIRYVSVMIRKDSDAVDPEIIHDLSNIYNGSSSGSTNGIDGTNITLIRELGGWFDRTDYDDGSSWNRGWLSIWYTP